MASTYFFVFFVFLFASVCFIETTSAAAGWCYQCDSRTAGCQIVVDAEMMAYHKIPCSGQCYVRVKDGLMSRGCSWEHGFMTNQASYTPLFEQEAMWLFCDTALCNANA